MCTRKTWIQNSGTDFLITTSDNSYLVEIRYSICLQKHPLTPTCPNKLLQVSFTIFFSVTYLWKCKKNCESKNNGTWRLLCRFIHEIRDMFYVLTTVARKTGCWQDVNTSMKLSQMRTYRFVNKEFWIFELHIRLNIIITYHKMYTW